MAVESQVPHRRVSFETAAQHASTAVPIASPSQNAGDVRRSLIGQRLDCASHVVVCDDDRFAGILRIEALFGAPDETAISDLMDREAPSVAQGLDQEVAAWLAVRHEESALAVVDEEGRFVGLIPPDRLLAVLLSEQEEDLSRLGGFVKSTGAAHDASVETVDRRYRHRIPWLLVGLAGALLAADLVGWFEKRLHENVMLAFFIDHEIAKRVRDLLGLNPPGGGLVDDISYSSVDGASVFTHPLSINTWRNGAFIGNELAAIGY